MIEKNIRLQPHRSRDLLVGRRSDGRRPGYQPPGHGTGGGRGRDDPSPSSGGGGGPPGGGDPGMAYTAPAPDYSSLDNEEQQAVDRGEPTAQITPKERNEQGYGPGGTNNPDYKQKQYEITGDIDELADFTGIDTRPKVDIKDIMGEVTDPGSVSYDPTYKTPAEIRTLSQDPDYGQFFRQPTVIEKPKSGLGALAKGALMTAAWPVAGALATKLGVGEAYRLGKLGYDIKQRKGPYGTALKFLEKKSGKKFKIQGTDETPKVAEKVWGPQKYLQPKKKTLHKDDNGRADVTQILPETLQSTVSEGTQMFLTDEQREQYQLAQNKMKAALAEGFYIDKDGKHIDLSEEQINALTQWITKINDMLIDPMPVGAAEGGRIDKALTGRSRDI